MAFKVQFAVYGALADGDKDKTQAAIVTNVLQRCLDRSDTVRIDNDTFGDPAKGHQKHFAAIVDGQPYACQERQTIRFVEIGSLQQP